MTTVVEGQNERAFQKQPTIHIGSKRLLASKSKTIPRYVRSVGLGFKTPRSAVEGTYIDKKCPWVGNVSIRGRILRGTVQSTKMQRTIAIRRDYLHYIKKYGRFEKRHSNFSAHLSPALIVKSGDQVVCGQCRPLSKTVRFNVLQVYPQGADKKGFSKF